MQAITLTTDFGARDWFVGAVKGVILSRHPRAVLVDLTHEVPPGDVRAAAFTLRNAFRTFPPGTVHVAVVDPGVGGPRAGLAARADGRFFVGPDNGVLEWALRETRSPERRRIENPRLHLPAVSATFHGRDVFAPVAAYLSQGNRFERVGPRVQDWVQLPWPEPERTAAGARGQIVYVDRFGNAITNLPCVDLDDSTQHSDRVQLASGRQVPFGSHYASVPPGQPVAVCGSSGFLELAVNGGSAAATLGLQVGEPVSVASGDRHDATRRGRSGWRGRAGFTLIELLVVVAIVAVLAGLLLPALTRAKGKAHELACLSNYRQLQLCWLLYVDDFQGWLPPNATRSGGGRDQWIATGDTWIAGNAWTDSSSIHIEQGVLFPYHRSIRLYRCPADRSTIRDQGRFPRFRSVSMSSYMNDVPDPADRTCWHRLDQVRQPPPSRALVFVDEHEGSIENARFVITQPGQWRWVDIPATRHRQGAVLTFADGHAEVWRWIEPNTLAIARKTGWVNGEPAVPGRDRDLSRIHQTVPLIPIP